MFIKTKMLGVVAALALLCSFVCEMAEADSIFPAVTSGEAFAGVFSIDPTTPDTLPPSCGFCFGGTGVRPSVIGNITVQIGANVFSGPIDSIIVVPGTDNDWRWDLQSNDTISLNGTPLNGSSSMSIQLYGSTSSSDILPLSFFAYTLGVFQIEAVSSFTTALPATAFYLGDLNNMVQLDSTADFAFSGTISESDQFTPLPAGLPLFATGLGVMGLFGWRRKRKNATASNQNT
ncbi:MAG: VPLPA-CTERM sorting domain-containing protein [Xanthobacteraceae bacterium]